MTRHRSVLEEIARENRATHVHAVLWEVVSIVLMMSAIVATVKDWHNPTALAGTSIAAATLALYRSGK